jgi:ribonuclease HI
MAIARKDDSQVGFRKGCTKEQAAQDFKSWLQRQNPLDLVVYTDGSQIAHPRRAAGAGWAIYWGRDHPVVITGNLPLPKAEVFDAEAVAALHGLRQATASFQARYANNVLICLDNLEVARILGTPARTSSQQVFTQFQETQEAWQARERLPHTAQGRVIVRWIPGHAGVAGNEKADQEAKAAAARAAVSPAPEDVPSTLAYTRRQAKEQATQAFQNYWAENAPKRYADLEIPLQKAPTEIKLPRYILGKLYASRTGHRDFADYHNRLNHADAECHCQCEHRKTPEYFYYCRLAKRAAGQRRHPAYNLREMLATPREAQEFNSWLNETSFYKDICPMRRPAVLAGQMPQSNSHTPPPSLTSLSIPPSPPPLPASSPTHN